VKVNGHYAAACTTPATPGMRIENHTDEIQIDRRRLTQMLFVEGNHYCPFCEKSGNCGLQALGYDLGVVTAGFRHLFPDRPVSERKVMLSTGIMNLGSAVMGGVPMCRFRKPATNRFRGRS